MMSERDHARPGPWVSRKEQICPQCESGILTLRHCKAVCERCGYVESCEDNFVSPPAGPDEAAEPRVI